jgi:hypothetical protein
MCTFPLFVCVKKLFSCDIKVKTVLSVLYFKLFVIVFILKIKKQKFKK